MFIKTLLSAGVIGLASLTLSGCVSDPYYYDDYPLYRGGYYSTGVVVYDSGPRVRPHYHGRRHVERQHRPRVEHWRDHRPHISRRGSDRNHYDRRWQQASAISPDRRFDRNWRHGDDRVWIQERSSRR